MNQRKPCGFTGDGDIWQEINPHYRLQQKRNHSTGLIKTEKGFPGDRESFFRHFVFQEAQRNPQSSIEQIAEKVGCKVQEVTDTLKMFGM